MLRTTSLHPSDHTAAKLTPSNQRRRRFTQARIEAPAAISRDDDRSRSSSLQEAGSAWHKRTARVAFGCVLFPCEPRADARPSANSRIEPSLWEAVPQR